MTPKERADPDLINGSRRLRIAQGLGPHGAGSESAAGAVQADAEVDEGRGQDRRRRSEAALRAVGGSPRAEPQRHRRATHGNSHSSAPRRPQELPLYRIVVADQEVAARRAVHRDDRHLRPEGSDGRGQGSGRRREGARTGSPRAPRRRDTVQSLLKKVGRVQADRRSDATAPATWWSGGCASRTD